MSCGFAGHAPAFAPLLDAVEQVLGGLEGLIFVADALHKQVNHAKAIAARDAHLLIPVKGNRPTLHAQLKMLPWAQIPIGHHPATAKPTSSYGPTGQRRAGDMAS